MAGNEPHQHDLPVDPEALERHVREAFGESKLLGEHAEVLDLAGAVAREVVKELGHRGRLSDDWAEQVSDAVVVALQANASLSLGQWLLDIGRVRVSLKAADDLLRRMEDAVIRSGLEGPGL